MEQSRAPAEREALLRRGLGAWSRDDVEGALAMFHPRVEWHLSGIFPDFVGTVRGHDGVREFWRSFGEPWERIELAPEAFHHQGDWIVAEVRFTAVGRDGVRVELPQAHACRLSEGLVIEYRSFRELDEALAAVSGA